MCDAAGNRTAAADDFGTHSYGYDALDRLTSAVHPSSGALSIQNETFSYDAVDNRLSDAVRSAYNYNAGNQLTGDSVYTYSYDNNGNLTTRTRTSDGAQDHFTYSGENRLTQAAMATGYTVNYRYDASGRRLSRRVVHGGEEVSAENYVYDGSNMLAAVSPSGEVRTLYTHGLGMDSPLMLSKGSSNYFMLADGLGSVIAVVDAQGNVVERMQYQAYGKPVFMDATGTVSPVSISGSHYSYTGREYDADTGLFYYRARYYDAETGRFIQRDPIGFSGGDTNFYAYVGNRPINGRDPAGLFLWPWESPVSVVGGNSVERGAVSIAINKIYSTIRGKELLAVIIGPWYRHGNPVTVNINANQINRAYINTSQIDLDPNSLVWVESREGPRQAGLTQILSHEMCHVGFKTRDAGFNRMDNVVNENLIISELGLPFRVKY